MKNKKNEHLFMQRAIAKARQGIQKGQTPFGACIVQKGKVISCEHNRVFNNKDITAHAEICAIRKACQKLRSVDLSNCEIYSTCEPCPMCYSAIHWARIPRIVYGARIQDAKRCGFNELRISNQQMKKSSKGRIKLVPDFLRQECLMLFKVWSGQKNRKAY